MKKSICSLLAIFLLSSLSIGCSKSNSTDEDSETPTGPTVGTAIQFSSVTSSGLTATWGAASSPTTATANLQYKLVYSASNNVSTTTDALANGTVAMDWTANTLTSPVTGLSHSTTYYFAVLVKDSGGNMAIETSSQLSLCSGKVVFLLAVSNGNMGGASGADALCNANKPSGLGGATFKAMLNDATRAPCTSVAAGDCSSTGVTTGRMDWVFGASSTLCTSDYTKSLGTTTANGYPQIPTAGVLTSTTTQVFTGMNIYMGTASSNNCSDWTSTSGSAVTGLGNSTSNNHDWWASNSSPFLSCNSAGKIYCVEQ